MSSSTQINGYEVPSIVEGDHDYAGLNLAKQEQDDNAYDRRIPAIVNTISKSSIQPMVIRESGKEQCCKCLISFNLHNLEI